MNHGHDRKKPILILKILREESAKIFSEESGK